MYVAIVFRSLNDEAANPRPLPGTNYARLDPPDVVPEEDEFPSSASERSGFTVAHTILKPTAQEAAQFAENKRLSLSNSYPSHNYRIWVGLLSHEVQRPEPRPLQLVELA